MQNRIQKHAKGFAIAFATWVGAYQLGFVTALGPARLLTIDEYWLGCWISLAIGLLYGFGRVRRALHLIMVLVATAYTLVVFTPLVNYPVRMWLYQTPDRATDALVVLSAGSTEQGAMDASGLERLTSALLELSDHMPAALVVTELPTSTDADIRSDQKRIIQSFSGQWFPPLSHYAVGPVASTYDEAIKTKALAEKHRWRSITLVTAPMHMRRAAATFRKAGLDVVARPSLERNYSVPQLGSPRDRLYVFKDLATEIAGYLLYRVKGRV